MVRLWRVGRWMVFAISRPVLGQSTTASLTPSMIIEVLPDCATLCFTNTLQLGSCSTESMKDLSDCLCTNVLLQSSYSACVQQNCSIYESSASLLVESDVCEAYPRQSRAYEAIVAATITFIIAVPVIIARCTARIQFSRKLWADDYVAIVATLFLLVLATVQIVCVQYGFGFHQWEAEIIENNTMLLQLLFVSQIFYAAIQCIARLSILLLYRRIFGTNTRWLKWTINIMIGATFIIIFTYTSLLIFQCWPVAAAWDLTIPDSKCYNFAPLLFSGALISIVADLILMIIPVPELRKLQINGRKRIGVGIMFAIASLGMVASLVRLNFLVKLNWSYDLSWDEIDVVIWSLIELLCIVVCGSLPALRPYVRSLNQKITATLKRSSQSLQRSRGSIRRRSAETEDSLRELKHDRTPYDGMSPLQLHPLSSVKPVTEWDPSPNTPLYPPRVVTRESSLEFGSDGTTRLPSYERATRSYLVTEFRDGDP